MYWRIRKIRPEDVTRKYGVWAVCAVSVLINIIVIADKIQHAKVVTSEQKANVADFARQVSLHFFDATYLTIADSIRALSQELSADAYNRFVRGGDIPATPELIKAVAFEMTEAKSLSAIRYDSIDVGEEMNSQGYVPVSLRLTVAQYGAEGFSGPKYFSCRYLMGRIRDPQTNESRLIAVSLEITPCGPPSAISPQ